MPEPSRPREGAVPAREPAPARPGPPLLDDHPEFLPRNRSGLWLYRLGRALVAGTCLTGRPFRARWLEVAPDGRLTIPPGYAWDGCTPKFSVLDLFIVGTPDGIPHVGTGLKRTGRASVVHDALYQYLAWHDFSRREADRVFLDLLREDRFALARVYWLAVRIFGGLLAAKKHPDRLRIRAESA